MFCDKHPLCAEVFLSAKSITQQPSFSSSTPTLSIMLLTMRGFFKICCPIPVLNMSPGRKHERALISQRKADIRLSQRRKQGAWGKVSGPTRVTKRHARRLGDILLYVHPFCGKGSQRRLRACGHRFSSAAPPAPQYRPGSGSAPPTRSRLVIGPEHSPLPAIPTSGALQLLALFKSIAAAAARPRLDLRHHHGRRPTGLGDQRGRTKACCPAPHVGTCHSGGACTTPGHVGEGRGPGPWSPWAPPPERGPTLEPSGCREL